MEWVRYGGRQGKAFALTVSDDFVAVRTRSRGALEMHQLSRAGWEAARNLALHFRLHDAGVEVHRVRAPRRVRAARDRVRKLLPAERDVAFAGRVLCHPQSGEPVLYTENIFVQFRAEHAASRCRRVLEQHGLKLKREVPYLRNAYFMAAPPGCGMEVFAAARRLLDEDVVECCHPELVWEAGRRQVLPFQWHLGRTAGLGGVEIDAHASVEAAWAVTRGAGTVIAVIDDGFDIDHEELESPDKIVAPRDVTARSDDPRPGADDNNHGTPCAGVACADGLHAASGVAPLARLMPIRLVSGLGSQDEADAIHYAAANGADVISCSWGPKDGNWLDPNDPLHAVQHPLPDATRLALEWATTNGRGGRGCVITWAAGNGNESVGNDGYASNDRVIAVAAVNDQGRRSPYSDKGAAIWCSFPSNDPDSTRTTGIWTIDRSGRPGYNTGRSSLGDRAGHYTNRFQGTSSACPGVAGVAALVLSVAPHLTWRQVRDVLKDTADRVDAAEGQYDANGHSIFYGYGRVNAERAVRAVTRAPAPERAPARVAARTGTRAAVRAAVRTAAPAAPRSLPTAARIVPADVTIRVKTDATTLSLRLDDRALTLTGGQARTRLEPGRGYVLAWWLEGPPGATYRIDVDGGPYRVRGSFPITRQLGRRRTKDGGATRLELKAVRKTVRKAVRKSVRKK